MGACRESFNIWSKPFWKYKQWKKLFNKNYDTKYFWVDSFRTPFYKIWCLIFGHKNVKNVGFANEEEFVCFNCYRKIEINKIFQKGKQK